MPASDDMPSTVRRSPQKARETWAAAHDAAVEQYGEGQRAHRTAFAALKRGFEKVGDRWEPKKEEGPSDAAAETHGNAPSAGGVNANAPKSHLLDIATRLDIRGRWGMAKADLVDAIQRENEKRTRKSAGS